MSDSLAEFAYIDWLRKQTPTDARVLIGPGDDTAAVELSNGRPLLITTDMLMEGSCFLLAEAGARRVGRKAMNVNLSDIAAMAGVPIAAVVSVGLPRIGGRALAEELYPGLRDAADSVHVPLVGGDTNSWNGPLTISVTMLGQATERGPVRRNGAKVGDWILVTGSLGGSIRGKHLDFVPRIKEALQLHEHAELHALIDISDGLTADLWHICEESQCGAVLFADRIPITEAAHDQSASDGKSALEHALGDGEDFELIVVVSPEDGARLLRSPPVELHHIGECVESGLSLEASGARSAITPKGYIHHFE